MQKQTKEEKKVPGKPGQPTKYKKQYDKQVFKLGLLGANDKEIADFFEVHVDTIYEWKIKHKGFSESIKKGKLEADTNVAERLYTRALGYQYKEVTYEENAAEEEINSEGLSQDVSQPKGAKKKTVVKQQAPDTTAIIFWLKNRQPRKFRDKVHVETKDTSEKPDWLDSEISNEETPDA